MDAFAKDWRAVAHTANFDVVLEYCDKLSRASKTCDQEDVARLQRLGYSDRAISEAVQICSYFNYINRIADGLGVDPEAWLDELGRVKD